MGVYVKPCASATGFEVSLPLIVAAPLASESSSRSASRPRFGQLEDVRERRAGERVC